MPYPEKTKIQAMNLLGQGLSVNEAAKSLGIAAETVRLWARAHGIKSSYGGKGRPRAEIHRDIQRDLDRQSRRTFDIKLNDFAVRVMEMMTNQAQILGDEELLRDAAKSPERYDAIVQSGNRLFANLRWFMEFEQRVVQGEKAGPIEAEYTVVPELVADNTEQRIQVHEPSLSQDREPD